MVQAPEEVGDPGQIIIIIIIIIIQQAFMCALKCHCKDEQQHEQPPPSH
jgi:hypothetical protein